jgi:hypothetical protein
MIATDGHEVKLACRVLEVTRAGYYAFATRGPSPRAIRHAWLTDLITQIHAASRGTYGAPRVHAKAALGSRHHRRAQRGRDADAPRRSVRPAAQAPGECALGGTYRL